MVPGIIPWNNFWFTSIIPRSFAVHYNYILPEDDGMVSLVFQAEPDGINPV